MKNVLITGGAGDIARAIKEVLESSGGYCVCNPSRTELDVSNIQSVKDYLKNRTIDILINNAGFIETNNLLESSLETEQHSIAVNLLGVLNCSHVVLQTNKNAKDSQYWFIGWEQTASVLEQLLCRKSGCDNAHQMLGARGRLGAVPFARAHSNKNAQTAVSQRGYKDIIIG